MPVAAGYTSSVWRMSISMMMAKSVFVLSVSTNSYHNFLSFFHINYHTKNTVQQNGVGLSVPCVI